MQLAFLLQLLAAGLLSGERSYVVRGATLKCSNGTDAGVLNLPECHGVYIKDKAVMTVADALPEANISKFGFCKETGSLCEPSFCAAAKWSGGMDEVLLDDEAALLDNSKLVCLKKGVISIEWDGQD